MASILDIALEVLPKDKENAVTQTELADRLGITKREVRIVINNLREHYCICSGNEGYWISNKASDVKEFLMRQDSQIKEMIKTRDYMISHLMQLDLTGGDINDNQ